MNRPGYIEIHHVIPKSLGGDDDVLNLVPLSAREHFIAHWLLMKMTEGDDKRKMANAFNRMLVKGTAGQERYTPKSSRVYQNAREACNENMKGKKHTKASIDLMKKNRAITGWTGKANSMYGKKHSEETKKKISEKAKQRTNSLESNSKRSATLTGGKRSPETVQKMKEAWDRRRAKAAELGVSSNRFKEIK